MTAPDATTPNPKSPSHYQVLDGGKITQTVAQLERRIGDRFPDSGLRQTCQRLLDIAEHARERSEWIGQPILWVRVASGAMIALILVAIPAAFIVASGAGTESLSFVEIVQTAESMIADLVYVGAAIFFLGTLEGRIKRRRALAALDELRGLAHIIDMLQLTKDPERMVIRGEDTLSSPKRDMTAFQLSRYLDYCTEMLSLTGKVAALYGQAFSDSVALAAVNEIEALTTGLSRKIWQKLMIVNTVPG